MAANRAVARLKDRELEEQVRQRANAPLVVILKHPEPCDDLNPSVQVMFRPLGQLAGTPAAYMKATYRVANQEGREFRALSRMWIVPRGAFMFLISASGPREGPDVSEAEFEAILDSMRIER